MTSTPRTADGIEICIGMTVWLDGCPRKVEGYTQSEAGDWAAILDGPALDDRGRVTLWSFDRLWAVPPDEASHA